MRELKQLLVEYEIAIAATDIINPEELRPIQQGLFGEVGGIMATAKKHVREKSAYPGYKKAAEDEFGDTLWYLSALCRRRKIRLADVIDDDLMPSGPTPVAAELDVALMRLGNTTASMLVEQPSREQIQTFASHYLGALSAAGLSFEDVIRANQRKACGAFLDPLPEDLIDFDKEFGPEEQLPRDFRIRVNQRKSGKSYLQWKGVFIGNPLTDNITDSDGYRFHDVFHFANAAILHWSPVVRALIKQKRKSNERFDEEQDSGRAIVVEEGVTAWIFSRAKELNYFDGLNRVPLGILKTIGEFVNGYEVENCPLKLWENSVLQGYEVFRKLRAAEGGIIVGNREARTLRFEPLEATE